MVAIPGEHLDAGGNRDRKARRGEEAQGKLRQAGGDHVVHPQAEAQEACGDQGQNDPAVADQPDPDHGRQDHRDHGGGRQEDDVDLRMAEEPELVLPQQRVATLLGQEERPLEAALQLQQGAGEDQRREGEHDHPGEHQHRPGVHRHLVERHARRPRAQDADDDLDRAGNGGDLDEADAEQPEIGVVAG
jgi:hypothetical protein